MYSLRDFVEYDDSKLDANRDVLVWSRATGYMFTQYAKVSTDQKICAMVS